MKVKSAKEAFELGYNYIENDPTGSGRIIAMVGDKVYVDARVVCCTERSIHKVEFSVMNRDKLFGGYTLVPFRINYLSYGDIVAQIVYAIDPIIALLLTVDAEMFMPMVYQITSLPEAIEMCTDEECYEICIEDLTEVGIPTLESLQEQLNELHEQVTQDLVDSSKNNGKYFESLG